MDVWYEDALLEVLCTVEDLTDAGAGADVDVDAGDVASGSGGDGDVDGCLSEFNFFSMALIFASVLYRKTINS